MEKDFVFTGKIKHKGVFDFSELYRFAYQWLIDKDYWVVEKVYSEKVTPGGKGIEIGWEAKRKISDYFAFTLKINWRVLGMKDVEVTKDGDKIKMNSGIPEIKVAAVLVKDYENNWAKSPFLNFLRTVYDRYLIRGRIDAYETKLHGEADEFLAQAKAFLALEGKR